MGDMLHRALGEIMELETVSTAGLWRVEADPNQLEATILNLAAERAATLTQRLLAFSRRQPLAPKPIDVDRLLRLAQRLRSIG
jgi:hypothetical protein